MILLFKLQIHLDPDRIPLTYVSVTFTDYRSAFSPTVSKVKTMYQEYTNLLLAKCSTIDMDLSVKSTRMPKRLVYNTDTNPTEDEVTTTNEIDSFGIDSNSHTLLANAHQTYGMHATRMAGKTWHKLSPTAQGIWDQLGDESKALILGQSPESKRSDTFSCAKPGRKGSHHGANKINLHDISAHDLLANYHQYQAHQMDEDEGVVLHDEDVAGTPDGEPNPLLAFVTSRGDSAMPGNLQPLTVLQPQSHLSNVKPNMPISRMMLASTALLTAELSLIGGPMVAYLVMMHASLPKLTGLSMFRAFVTTKSRISRLSLPAAWWTHNMDQ